MKKQIGKLLGTKTKQANSKRIQSDFESDTQTASRKSLASGFRVSGLLLLAALPASSFAGSSWTKPNSYSAYEGGQDGNSAYSPYEPIQQSRRQTERRTQPTSPFSPESQNVALGVGQIFLMGDAASKFENGIGYQLDYTYGVSRIFGFTSSLGFSSHDQTGTKNNYSQVNLQTGMRANLNSFDQVVPFAKAGLGFYRATQSATAVESVSALMFGIHIGAGLDLHISNRAFFGADLTVHDVFGSTERASTGLIPLGGSHTSFTAHVGVVL